MAQIRRKLENIRVSLRAIRCAWNEEFSFRVEVVGFVLAMALSYFLNISTAQFVFLIAAFGALLTVELLNTAIEDLCDYLTADHDPRIGKIKDLASGAVLVVGLTASIVCVAVFVPPLIAIFD